MQMKRILGILLALCFLMSVTAVAVSAKDNQPLMKEKPNKEDKRDKKEDKDNKQIEKKVIKIFS